MLGVGQQVAGHSQDLVVDDGGAASDLAAGSGGGRALAGAGDDEFADELGQGGEDVEDESAAGGGGVQVLVQRGEADLALPDFLSAKIFRQPAAVRASIWRSIFCPLVNTRALALLVPCVSKG